jgi:hypothetical protein
MQPLLIVNFFFPLICPPFLSMHAEMNRAVEIAQGRRFVDFKKVPLRVEKGEFLLCVCVCVVCVCVCVCLCVWPLSSSPRRLVLVHFSA